MTRREIWITYAFPYPHTKRVRTYLGVFAEELAFAEARKSAMRNGLCFYRRVDTGSAIQPKPIVSRLEYVGGGRVQAI